VAGEEDTIAGDDLAWFEQDNLAYDNLLWIKK
jgi:hypothetical protein